MTPTRNGKAQELPDRDMLLSLYRSMALAREADEEMVRRYPEQKMRCPVHLSVGQEAVAAGVCAAMLPGDVLFSGHRCHAHYLAAGGSIDAMIAEVYGKTTGCCAGKGGSMHLADPGAGCMASSAIVAGSIPVAVGAALGMRRLGRDGVAVSFAGDGAVDEGVFYESMNFAALHRLPVLFAIENNFYATQSPTRKRHALDNIHRRGSAFGIPGHRMDGNDVLAVYSAAKDAFSRMRTGGGPVLMEFRTYRWYGHVGTSDDAHMQYRPDGELKKWKRACPIKKFKKAMLAASALSSEDLQTVDAEIKQQVAAAFDSAEAAPFPEAGC